MKTQLLISGLAASAILSGRVDGPSPRAGPLESPRAAITNVTVIDGTGRGPAAGMTVAVDRGRITYVGRSAQRPEQADERVIDGRGKFLLPGLIDTHAHFTYIEWPADPANGAIGQVRDDVTTASLRLLLQFGVTTIRNPAGPTAAAVGFRNR